tara:strand:- start:302 stop:454 length:153 start_codon:yes stop_codon:yes gene_type:complete
MNVQELNNDKENVMKLSDFRKKFGEGTDFDLDYGKLVILALCIYIAIKVS